jgi:hypothetical protein
MFNPQNTLNPVHSLALLEVATFGVFAQAYRLIFA